MSISNFIVDGVEPILDDIDETFEDFTPLVALCQRTKVRPAYFVLGFFLTSIITLGTGIFSHLFVALFGMAYPSYMSCKAINAKNYQKNKEWLTYWIVFGFFTAFAKNIRWVFFFVSLRSFNVLRMLFYIFLFHPKTNGAAFLYKYFLRKRFTQVQNYLQKQKQH